MIKLYDEGTGALIGAITEDQLKFLRAQMEEESLEDSDYYVNAMTIDGFELAGGDAALIKLLRQALGDREDMDIQWVRE